MAADETRDSRASSSSNSPAPPDNEESDFYLGANDSQTSLGVVPNMQDMQVNDLECTSTIAALPSEILISIFSRLSDASDLFRAMLVCKRWSRNVVEILWHRPACSSWKKHHAICSTLGQQQPHFAYSDFVKRLNLAALADHVSDGSVQPLAVCSRVERLTLTNCKHLTDSGLIPLVTNNHHLLALDISGDENITENTISAIAENCRRLQGLNMTSCKNVSNESLQKLAENCRYIKRLKLNECSQVNDDAVLAFARNCPNILEIDLHNCVAVGNEPITTLMARGQSLRELRLAMCERIDDMAFLNLPAFKVYEHLRILDLTSCSQLTDVAVEKIIDVAPRLRNLVLAKCANITDTAVFAISRLSKNLHYIHLGHCRNITDEGVKRLVSSCNRIRYIDLGCLTHLTDESVTRLATLPKLKRIGLVKCTNITDASMYALARANHRSRARHDAQGRPLPHEYHTSSLERVHLSYCVNLTLPSIIKLLNCCPRLTHLSLTGVTAFLRDDLEKFCRDAPADFNDHQRSVFCVFSGHGVSGLRAYLNSKDEFADYHDQRRPPRRGALPGGFPTLDGLDDVDDIEDDDMGDGSEIALDTGPGAQAPPPPPPPPAPPSWAQHLGPMDARNGPTVFPGTPQAPPFFVSNDSPVAGSPAMVVDATSTTTIPVRPESSAASGGHSLESTMAQPPTANGSAGPSLAGAALFSQGPTTGPSTASMQGQRPQDDTLP